MSFSGEILSFECCPLFLVSPLRQPIPNTSLWCDKGQTLSGWKGQRPEAYHLPLAEVGGVSSCCPAGDKKEQMPTIRLGSRGDHRVSSASPLLVARGKLPLVLLCLLLWETNWGLSSFPEITGVMSNSLQRSVCEHAFLGTR